ncbi:transglutaminase domain-containing protein, partial [Phocaeicola sp.]|uniref:transglutaminase domain-containing protein n=1 Tax=Phocaeicola sp. TaxID=2773926 RepID=UPI00283E3A0C
LGLWLSCLFPACTSSDHFLKETDYRQKVETDFNQKKEILNRGNLFAVFNEEMTQEEREAMMFLYAYMTPGDIADYSGEFYLKNVRLALQDRKQTTWGAQIPDLIFRHFVLPVRVNNENLDNAREVFRQELMPRVEKLSMYDAVLEVNHWCHEKVVYTPTDSRTSAPLATVKTAYGRCGEESTFLVAALRAVGIPARQVYTPRWAHTDDNHAWVEAWVDGKWYFLGACEPEPVLNLGWFNAPASRGMLMHTKVFGAYNGPEDVMKTTANYTEINIIDNYAQSAPVTVTVVDSLGKAVEGARVEFKLYNYAEFYTVASKTTDVSGKASLSAGLGDMLVYASADQRFGLKKVSFGKDKKVTLTLSHRPGDVFADTLHIVPPAEKANLPEVTEAQRKENTLRMAQEDSIRNAYVASFPTEEKAKAFAQEQKLDEARTSDFIVKSRGNYTDIMQFLSHAVEKGQGTRALELLGTLAEKDLRDTPCSILEDHLYGTDTAADVQEVLAPRIASEMLTPYRSYLQKAFPTELASQIKADPQVLVKWCKDSLTIRNDLSTLFTTTSPEGVWRSRVTDSQSRDIFFVAAARSLGIPAWKDEVNGNICYRLNGNPVLVDFEKSEGGNLSEGTLKATYEPIPRLDNPKYYTHFTLSKYDNGTFQLQNHPEDASWASLLKNGSQMSTGYYMLVTGSRMANGGVLSQVSFFTVEEGKTMVTPLCMRDNTEEVRVIGNFNSEALYTRPDNGEQVSILSTTGRGYYIVGVLGVGQEPTNHALKDIEIKKAEFEKWGRTIVLLFTDEAAYRKFDRKEFPNLPSNVVFGIDKDGSILKMIAENMKLGNKPTLPVIILGDTFNRVVFESHGYTIGMGEQLLHVIHGL